MAVSTSARVSFVDEGIYTPDKFLDCAMTKYASQTLMAMGGSNKSQATPDLLLLTKYAAAKMKKGNRSASQRIPG
jgi:hypothetical protein